MKIQLGFEIAYQLTQPTPMMLTLNIHYSRANDLVWPDHLLTNPSVATSAYRDRFGNWCTRLVAPPGRFVLISDTVIRDSGEPDKVVPYAMQTAVENLPESTLVYLLGSRYCETDLLSDFAWAQFGSGPSGWGRVQAVCDFVHQHIAFGYHHARPTRSAFEAFNEGHGVCRDYAHLAVALCRCLNIPARYCTGYLPDIGVPHSAIPMDFSAWFEAFLDGDWYTFDARHNSLRIGRVLMARGRDASDVALSNTFGPSQLDGFKVWCDEVS